MPEISITRPPTAWHLMVRTLAIPMAVLLLVGIVFGATHHKPGLIIGAILVPFLFCGGFLGQAWTVGRDQARKSQELIASSSPGTLYAGLATPIQPSGVSASRQRFKRVGKQGTLKIGPAGVSFEPTSSAVGVPEVYPWNGLARVIMTAPAPTAARLEIQTIAGAARAWQASAIPELIEALDQLGAARPATPPN